MSSVLKPLLTPQEYLARERAAEYKSEYYRGEMFAMAGASWEHTLVKDNTAREAGQQLRDGPRHVLTSDLRVRVDATGLYTYPDINVVGLEQTFAFTSIPVKIALADIYRSVEFPENAGR